MVSGQNGAFVLVLASPLTGRLRLGARWAVTLGVIAAFGMLTRFEPSVLRASAMAAVSVTAALAGRPAGSLRVLALAVAGLLVIDPLLVHAVGFQLSVAASLGIAVLGGWLADRLVGPRWLREALAITLAAQLGVAPILVPRFGGMPVVAIVANLAAVPVAGLVTTWGLPAGVVAGLGGPGVAGWAHLPTRLLVDWVAGVARVAASVPLGELDARALLLAVAGGWAVTHLGSHRRSWRLARAAAAGIVAVAVLAPAVTLARPPPRVSVADVGALHRVGGATVLVVDGRPPARALLEGLRRAGARRLDVVVSRRRLDAGVVAALRHRWSVGHLVAAADLPGAVLLRVGGLQVDVRPDRPPVVTVIRS